ncbi:MAG TPA: VOC family protein [Thermoanaerobaculia bacterium]|nr:VOC family protein [Thermoanaerobaculia bacterium]
MRITTFLMFSGAAEEAMSFYVSLFPNSRIVAVERYGPGEAGKEGTVKQAAFELNGMRLMCIDSPIQHPFTFTPATSLFVDVDDPGQIDAIFERLSEGGQTLMPLGSYGFSRRFAWVQDRYGVSWQLNLPYDGGEAGPSAGGKT